MDEMRPTYTANLGLATHSEKKTGAGPAGRRDLKEGGGVAGGAACFASLSIFPTNFMLSDVG